MDLEPQELLLRWSNLMVDLPQAELRPMKVEDLDLVLSWRNDIRVRHSMFTQHLIGEKEHRRWFESASMNPLLKHFIFMLDQVPSGFVSFRLASEHSSIAYWGFYKAPNISVRTRGSLGDKSLEYASRRLNLQKLYAEVISHNIVSIRFHQRLGFSLENTVKRGFFDGARHHDVLIMSNSFANKTACEAD